MAWKHRIALVIGVLVWVGVWRGWPGVVKAQEASPPPLPAEVVAEVVWDVGPGPVKVQRVTSTAWERDLYPGESGGRSIQVRNVTDGYGEATYTVDAVVTALVPLVVAGPASPVVVGPGDVGLLSWMLAVPPEAAVGSYEEVVELKAEGVVFARWHTRAGAGEPVVLRGFSYLNPNGNDVSAYVVWPKGTGRWRLSVENQGDAGLTVVVEVDAEPGLSCAADPASGVVDAGKTLNVVVTCEAAPYLDSSNDRLTVRFRRAG